MVGFYGIDFTHGINEKKKKTVALQCSSHRDAIHAWSLTVGSHKAAVLTSAQWIPQRSLEDHSRVP